jgi:hypothetical protein
MLSIGKILEKNGWYLIYTNEKTMFFRKPYKNYSFYCYELTIYLQKNKYKIIMRKPDDKKFYCFIPAEIKNVLEEELQFINIREEIL